MPPLSKVIRVWYSGKVDVVLVPAGRLKEGRSVRVFDIQGIACHYMVRWTHYLTTTPYNDKSLLILSACHYIVLSIKCRESIYIFFYCLVIPLRQTGRRLLSTQAQVKFPLQTSSWNLQSMTKLTKTLPLGLMKCLLNFSKIAKIPSQFPSTSFGITPWLMDMPLLPTNCLISSLSTKNTVSPSQPIIDQYHSPLMLSKFSIMSLGIKWSNTSRQMICFAIISTVFDQVEAV